jgi:hypothetical protein
VAPTITNRLVLMGTVAVAVVGAIDAGAGGSWDLVALFAFVMLLQLGVLVRLSSRRPEVRVRADLLRWLRDRAERGGEPVDNLVDRAISAYRADLLGPEPQLTPEASRSEPRGR